MANPPPPVNRFSMQKRRSRLKPEAITSHIRPSEEDAAPWSLDPSPDPVAPSASANRTSAGFHISTGYEEALTKGGGIPLAKEASRINADGTTDEAPGYDSESFEEVAPDVVAIRLDGEIRFNIDDESLLDRDTLLKLWKKHGGVASMVKVGDTPAYKEGRRRWSNRRVSAQDIFDYIDAENRPITRDEIAETFYRETGGTAWNRKERDAAVAKTNVTLHRMLTSMPLVKRYLEDGTACYVLAASPMAKQLSTSSYQEYQVDKRRLMTVRGEQLLSLMHPSLDDIPLMLFRVMEFARLDWLIENITDEERVRGWAVYEKGGDRMAERMYNAITGKPFFN